MKHPPKSTRFGMIAVLVLNGVALMPGCDASRRSTTHSPTVQGEGLKTSSTVPPVETKVQVDPGVSEQSQHEDHPVDRADDAPMSGQNAMSTADKRTSIAKTSEMTSKEILVPISEDKPVAEEPSDLDETVATNAEQIQGSPLLEAAKQNSAGVAEGPSPGSDAGDEMASRKSEPHYRLWLPTTQGPLLVGLEIWVGDLPLKSHFSSRVDALIEELNEPDQDSVSWDELIDHVSSNPNVFGASARQVGNQKANLKKRYDRNKNDKAERDELIKFVFRDSRLDSEFRLFGTEAFRWSNRTQSSLFSAIDRDKNRRLDASEIARAGDSILQRLDANADGCIDAAEASALSTLVDDGAWGYRRSHRQGEVAMDLSGYINWSNIAFAIGGMFGPVDFLRSVDLARQLDASGDERISKEEAMGLLEIPPPVTLVVRWPTTVDSSGLTKPTVQWVIDEDQTQASVEMTRGDALSRVATESFSLVASVNGQTRNRNVIPREAFDQLDANSDGGLDETEIPDGAEEILSLETKDRDGDGKLSYEEIIQLREDSRSIWDVQVRARGAEHPQPMFAWLDTNQDHFLSARELKETSSRLKECLAGRESIKANDLPDIFLLQFVRGEPGQDESRFTLQKKPHERSSDFPGWAVKMDSNRDGDISKIEFPGRIEQFETLDINGDGFLEKSEILRVTTGSTASEQ